MMTPQDIAKLIEMNKADAEMLKKDTDTKWYDVVLIDMMSRQQQLISYLLERDQQRTGDNR